MKSVIEDFVSATKMANRAGFDMIELHAAHGYLISSFIYLQNLISGEINMEDL